MADMSPTEVMALTRDNEGWGTGGGWMWIIVLFALIFGWGGNGWGNNNSVANAIGYENLATSNEVQRGFDNQNSMANQREILAAVNAGTAQTVATANQVFHDMLGVFSDKYSELQRDISGVAVQNVQLLANQNECCNVTQRAIDQVRYEAAMNTASINAISTENAQKILDAIAGNRMADMQNRINQLELAQAMQGVVRYPDSFAYNAGNNPFCNCGSGCCNV